MEYLLESLSAFRLAIGGSPLLFTIAIGVTVSLLVLAVLYLATIASDPVRKRVLQGGGGEVVQSSQASRVERAVRPIAPYIVPTKVKELSEVRRRLIQAGYRSNEAVSVLYAIKLVVIVTMIVLAAAIVYALPGTSTAAILISMAFAGVVGMLAPSYVLDKRILKRKTEIVNAFPDVLDMVVACSEAGLGLNDALHRVSRETALMFPILSEELALVNSQIRAGVERTDALRALAERTGVDEINSFVSMITQSVRFGTSISETLRIFAEEFRDKRMQRAEEQAAMVGTKLIFPLVLCIFPSFFVVAIGPAVIAIKRAFEQITF